MKRPVMTGLGVVAAAMAAGGAYYALRPAPKPGQGPPPPVPVVTAPVARGDVPIILSGLGTVQALNTAVIRAQVTGQLQTVNFVEGQEVKRGDLLAQIDPRPQQSVLDQAKAALTRDQTHLANAGVNLNRNLPLMAKGFATDQQVTDEQSQVGQLQAAIQADQAVIENAEAQLSYTRLTAPFDGVTGVRTLDVGNIIHPADANGLVTMTQVQPIAVLFTLPSKSIPDVQAALAAGEVKAVAYDQAGAKQLDAGKLLLVNNQADPATGTVQLKALFPNLQRLLWPGVFVNVDLTIRVIPNGLTVPTDAVQRGADGDFVFVVGDGGKVSTSQVQVEQRERGTALVSRGLQAGQPVVPQGQYRLADGTVAAPSKPEQVANESTATSGLLP